MRDQFSQKTEKRLPHSPQKSSNELNINKLGDFSINTGAAPGQFNHSWAQRKKSVDLHFAATGTKQAERALWV